MQSIGGKLRVFVQCFHLYTMYNSNFQIQIVLRYEIIKANNALVVILDNTLLPAQTKRVNDWLRVTLPLC